jgi:glyoxylase I family protein
MMRLLLYILLVSAIPFTWGCVCKSHEKPVVVRFEHIALNVQDPAAMAKWYCENLGMQIKVSKDVPAPSRFISDAHGNMMFELYHQDDKPFNDLQKLDSSSLHIAFTVDDVYGTCSRLKNAGAFVVNPPARLADAGVELCMLRDPWGLAIQIIKRDKPMLK